MDLTEGIRGKQILSILHGDYEDLYVTFSGGWQVAIFNALATQPRLWDESVGQRVTACETLDGECVRFTLSNGVIISVSLKDDDFVGPEAMTMWGPNDVGIVWN